MKQLQKLRVLKVDSCTSSAEVLFDFEKLNDAKSGNQKNAASTILSQLEEVYLYNLPKVKHVWKNGELACQGFQSLKILHVSNCDVMEHIIGEGEEDKKGAVVRDMVVSNCHKLKIVLAKHLMNLTTLTVENCSVVTESKVSEEIGVEENEGEDISGKTIELFPRVQCLTLKNLPNLTSFCATQGCTLYWPSLTEVVVTDCPRLKTFTLAVPSTPMEKEFETEFNKYTSVEHLDAKEKVVGTGIGEQEFHEPSGSFFMLVRADWTKLLQNLRVLEVGSCDHNIVFFDTNKVSNVEQENLENATNTILPLLEELYLYDFPKLKHVWKNSALAFQGFQALKILRVRDCRNMKHIVGEGEEEEEENKERAVSVAYILFPQLVKLHFYGLQNLMSIFSGNIYTLDWMSMEEIVLDDCPNLKTFNSSVVDHIIT